MRSAGVQKFQHFLKSGLPGPHAYVVLLGLTRFDFAGVIEQIEKGLPYSAFETLQKNTGLTGEQLLTLLQIPRRTLARRKTAGRFSPEESDRLVRTARVYGRALWFFDGDPQAATEWFTDPQFAFGGAVPLDMIRTDPGTEEVETLLGRLEHGILS